MASIAVCSSGQHCRNSVCQTLTGYRHCSGDLPSGSCVRQILPKNKATPQGAWFRIVDFRSAKESRLLRSKRRHSTASGFKPSTNGLRRWRINASEPANGNLSGSAELLSDHPSHQIKRRQIRRHSRPWPQGSLFPHVRDRRYDRWKPAESCRLASSCRL